jgi:hypothetical protein
VLLGVAVLVGVAVAVRVGVAVAVLVAAVAVLVGAGVGVRVGVALGVGVRPGCVFGPPRLVTLNTVEALRPAVVTLMVCGPAARCGIVWRSENEPAPVVKSLSNALPSMVTLTVLFGANPVPKMVKSSPGTPLVGETPTVGGLAAILNGASTTRAASATPVLKRKVRNLGIGPQGTSLQIAEKQACGARVDPG